MEILSIRDRVWSGSDKGWAMHIDSSLLCRGRVTVPPFRKFERGDPQGVQLLSFCCASDGLKVSV